MKILLTTPDYPPKLGGLATFCKNIENSLKKNNIDYDLLVWNSIGDLRKKSQKIELTRYLLVMNVQFMGGYFLKSRIQNHMNFIHGSEILFYSPNPFKRYFKQILKKNMITFFENSMFNFFISEFTRDTLSGLGMKEDLSRDLIFHDSIDVSAHDLSISNFNDNTLKIICVARDVPHKNFEGVLKFCEKLTLIANKRIKLFVTSDRLKSNNVKIKNISGIDEASKEKLMREAHFNVLFSKDNRSIGFIEGFGLTVLEAGKYGTPTLALNSGGLPESVHHGLTGFVFNKIDSSEMTTWWEQLNQAIYEKMCNSCYHHTVNSHSLNNYERLFGNIL